MRKLVYGLLGLLVILVVAVLVGPSFIDWNHYKDRITAEVRAVTGRDLVIDGDVQFSILPAPALSAERVRFANLQGGTKPYMAELEGLRVRVAFLPLLRQHIQFESVSLLEPDIYLEVLADGRRNWEFGRRGAEGQDPPAGDTSAEGFAAQIQVDSFTITGGTLTYRNAVQGARERLEGLDAEVVAESLAGPVSVEGSALLRGVAVDFQLALGRLVQAGAIPVNVRLGLPETEAEAQFAGSVSSHPETLSYRGQVKGSGADLAAVIAAATAEAASALPPVLRQAFTLDGQVKGDAGQLSLSALTLGLGDTTVSGEATLGLDGVPALDLSLGATRIDLDGLLARGREAAATGGAPEPVAAEDPAAESAVPLPALPAGVKARLRLAIEGVVYRGQAVRQLRLDAALEDGRITFVQAMALLPGGSDLSLTGAVAQGDAGPRFEGRLETASDNLRGLAAWLGAGLDDVPPQRLRRMSLTGQVAATAQQVSLSDLDLRLDLSRITGGIVAVLRERPGLGIGLAIDSLNIDAYLPRDEPGPDAAAANGRTPDPAVPAILALADRFDANLDLRVGNLTYAGTSARDLRLEGTLQNGSLTLRELRAGDLAGGSVSLAGVLSGLATEPSVDDGVLDLSVRDPYRLARTFGLDPAALGRLGPFTLQGSFEGTRRDLAFDQQLAALGGRLGFAGTLRADSGPPAFDVALTATHPDLAGFAAALGLAVPAGEDVGGLDLTGRLAGTPLALKLTDLKGTVAGTGLAGSLSADLSEARPAFTATATAGELPLAVLLAPAGGARNGSARWSAEPIDLDGLRGFDLDLVLAARALLLDELRLDDVSLKARLTDGMLDLERLIGTAYGGAFQLAGRVSARDRLESELDLTAVEVDLGPLLRDRAGFDRISGPLTLNASLATSGASEAALIAALSGSGEVSGELTVAADEAEDAAGALALPGWGAGESPGLDDATALLLSAFAGAPAKLTGTFSIENGVVESDDLTVEGRAMAARTRGEIRLPSWQLDSRTAVLEGGKPAEPVLTLDLIGPLDLPNVRVGGRILRPAPDAPESPGSPGAEAVPESETDPLHAPAPQEGERAPEDLIKEILEGLKG